jgi:hypothetical protein
VHRALRILGAERVPNWLRKKKESSFLKKRSKKFLTVGADVAIVLVFV